MRVDIQSKAFAGKPVLGAITFDVPQGAFVSICGPSGIGKTTLLRIIAGLAGDYTGRIADRPALGMVFQEPALLPWLTIAHNVALVSELKPGSNKVLEQLAEVGLAGHETKYPAALSLGQARRAALARALINRPDLLLLDEPFVSLDAETAGKMRDLLMNVRRERGCSVLMVSHDVDEAHRLSDRVIMLAGTPAVVEA